MIVEASRHTVGDLFEGVMIPVYEGAVPGWRCRACGWTIGTRGVPPVHACPGEAECGAGAQGIIRNAAGQAVGMWCSDADCTAHSGQVPG